MPFQSIERPERDRLVLFLRQLVRHKANCRYLLDAGVVKSLVDLVTLSHLHTNRLAHLIFCWNATNQ